MSRFSSCLFLIGCLSVSIALSGQVRSMNLEEMTQRAARILTGRCIDSRVEHDPALRAEVAVVTLEVQRTLKGDHRESVTLRMLNAPHTDNGETATGFAIGEEVEPGFGSVGTGQVVCTL